MILVAKEFIISLLSEFQNLRTFFLNKNCYTFENSIYLLFIHEC